MRVCSGVGGAGGAIVPGMALGDELFLGSLLDGLDRVLLVVAHPIDLALFFGPTLSYIADTFKDPKSQVFILSVTDGEKIEQIRLEEFSVDNGATSCQSKSPQNTNKDIIVGLSATYGVSSDNITILDSPHYRCDQKFCWDTHALRIVIRDLIIKEKIQYVFTFDHEGVDHDRNHRYTSIAIQEMMMWDVPLLTAEAGFKEAYELASHKGLLTYTSLLGVLLALAFGAGKHSSYSQEGTVLQERHSFSILKFSYYQSIVYLSCQKTACFSWQWLFVLFSSYSIYNKFVAVDRNPI